MDPFAAMDGFPFPRVIPDVSQHRSSRKLPAIPVPSSEPLPISVPAYHTPTTPAAKFLEQMVAQGTQPDPDTTLSPLPLYPPYDPPPQTKNSQSSSSKSSRSNQSISDFNYPRSNTPLYARTSQPTEYRESPPPIRPFSAYPPPPPSHSRSSHHPPRSSSRQDHASSHHDSRRTPHGDNSSSTKKSKHGTGFHRRLLSEILDHYPKLKSHERDHEQVHEDDHDRTPTGMPGEGGHSPTDSHPKQNYGSYRTRTHSRSRSSSDSLSTMLFMTTERLNHETARANAAEKQANEVMSLFKNTHEGKIKLETELMRVREELGLYKIQLDVAQKEIFRAQEIVDRVERQRVEAEDAALKAREKNRKLVEARAVDLAMEEGRRLGFEEGLKQGRFMAQAADEVEEYYRPRSSRRSASVRPEENVDREAYMSRYGKDSSEGSSHSSKSHKSSRSIPRPSSTAPNARRTTAPDVGTYAQQLPRPTLTTPMPLRVPSTQPQPAPAMPEISKGRNRSNSRGHPESITVQPSNDPNAPIRPISVRNSPAYSHRSIVLPPDNYIPTLGADSMISLPPPHELSMPVSSEVPAQQRAPSRPRPSSRAAEGSSSTRVRDYAYRDDEPDRSRRRAEPRNRGGEDQDARRYPPSASRRMSVTSRGSTRISELDMVSPPSKDQHSSRGHDQGRSARYMDKTKQRQAPEEQQWRPPNKEYGRPTTPASPTPRRDAPDLSKLVPSSARDHYGRPMSSETDLLRSPGTYPNRPPRRPREVVMPMPLGDQLLKSNTNANAGSSRTWGNPNHPSSSARQEYLAPVTPPHASRTTSSTTVPGIEVVTPSTENDRLSEATAFNPVLLTPDSANRPVDLPSQQTNEHAPSNPALGLYTNPLSGEESISRVLPDNNLPAGFVPLSPIPGMSNLNPYPVQFAPKDQSSGGMPPNYIYPSSPLIRPM